MPELFTFWVPGRPIPWARARQHGRFGHFTPALQAQDLDAVWAKCFEHAAEPEGDRPARSGSAAWGVSLRVNLAVPPSWSKTRRLAALAGLIRPIQRGTGDSDNYLKQVLDALQDRLVDKWRNLWRLGLWANDCQVVDARCMRYYGAQEGREVTVWIEQPPVI